MTIDAMQPVVIQTGRSEMELVLDEKAGSLVVTSKVDAGLAVELDGTAVRWDRIAELRGRIAAGTYRVSSMEVAERMMEGMLGSF